MTNLFNFYKFLKFNKKRLEKKSLYKIKKAHQDIVNIQLKARENGGLAGDYQWVRLNEIDKFIKKIKPKNVIEFGSGTSSALYAKLLNAKENFFTVEEDEMWYRRMIDSSGHYKNKMTALNRKRICRIKDGESVTYYDMPHDKYFDLVYVDGPTSFVHDTDTDVKILDQWGTMPNIDVELMWENKIYPKYIVVDGRRATVRRLIQKSADKYRIFLKTDYLLMCKIFNLSRYRYHTFFIRIGLTHLAVKIKSNEKIHNGIVNAIMGKKVSH